MTALAKPLKLTADAFVLWAMDQPQGRFELASGEVVAMAPERVGHVRAKMAAARALDDALRSRGLDCEALIDGVGVRVDDHTVFIPDVLVRCGPRTPDDAMVITDPMIVVEVVSPSSGDIDTGVKLAGYFRLPSVRHYLVIVLEPRSVTHHRRDDDGAIVARILQGGDVVLGPPGVTLEVTALFPPA